MILAARRIGALALVAALAEGAATPSAALAQGTSAAPVAKRSNATLATAPDHFLVVGVRQRLRTTTATRPSR